MPSYTVSILRSDQTSEVFHFSQPKVLIGRETGDLVVGDPGVSTEHGELLFENGTLTFRDLGSTNGTYRANGERITQPILVTPGTALTLGGATLTVQEIDTGNVGLGGTQVMPQQPTGQPAAREASAHDAPPPAAGAQPDAAPAPGAASPPAAGAAPEMGAPEAEASGHPGAASAGASASGGAAQINQQLDRLAASGPASEGLIDQTKYFLAVAANIYKEHYISGAMTMGLVLVPATLVSVAFGWIPIVGAIVGVLMALAQLALSPIAAGAMGRWALSAGSGKAMTWKQAWGAALKNPVSEWLNVAVASIVIALGTLLLVIPGIIVGMFALPAYLMEDKRFFSINTRSAELVMSNAGRHLGLGILAIVAIVPLMILTAIVGSILGFIPFIGPPLASLLSVAVTVTVMPFVYLVWTLVYFDVRKRIEGVDPRSTETARLQEWQGQNAA